jgi:type IX secretion system PorP/SprF family membrane protein
MMKRLQVIFICIAVFILQTDLDAQDMQFTQFYAAQTYLNPAFTGANVCSRLSTNYRNQWPSIPGAFVSYIVALDHYASSLNSGLGVMVTKDKAGSGSLRSTSINLMYAYELTLNKKWAFRAGFQASETIRAINFYDLVFNDQLIRNDAPLSVEQPVLENATYFDVSTGGLIYSANHWLGFSAHHLNVPNESLMQENSPAPVRFSMHGGTKIRLKEGDKDEWEQSISPAFNYRAQGKFDQFDLGLYYSYGILDLGAWYRGIPGLKAYEAGYGNSDAFALLAGMKIDRLRFGYSYDITISKLIRSTGGAHEISLSYEFCKLKKKRKKTRSLLVPCPKF